MPKNSLETNVRNLTDRAEIADLLYRYVMGASEHNPSMLVSIFSADVHLDYEYEVLDGIAAVKAYFENSPATAQRTPMGFDRHFSSSPLLANILIDLNGDEAHAESRGIVVHHGERDGHELFIMRSLAYSDDLIRLEEGWKIRVRYHPHPVWMLELDAQDPRNTATAEPQS